MKVLVWQWGRRGAGPRIAVSLARGFAALPGIEALLALSAGAEIMEAPDPPRLDLALPLYTSVPGLAARALQAPFLVPRLTRWLRRERLVLAVCAMPGPLDLMMAVALRRAGVPMAVVAHDADPHPGDGLPFLFGLNRALLCRADLVIALSDHVGRRLSPRRGVQLLGLGLPPLAFGSAPRPCAHGGPLRVLNFGRLLEYKGLDLLADALAMLGPRDMVVRVVGQGPESAALAALRRLPAVTVENRWVGEAEIGGLIGWADLIVLPYREASQSGVAAAALAAGRFVLSTRVGGLVQQLGAEPLASLCEPDAASLAGALGEFVECFRAAPPPNSLPQAGGGADRNPLSRLREGVRGRADPEFGWQEFARSVLAAVPSIRVS